MTAVLVEINTKRWWDHAACKNRPEFTDDFSEGKSWRNRKERAGAVHICVAHCPVKGDCLNDATDNPPCGVVMAGIVWETWAHKPTDRQPSDPGCGPWCAELRGLPKPTPSRNTLAGRLIDARTRAGLTQTDLARLSGLQQTTISRIEAGLREGHRRIYGRNVTVLGAIAEVLDVSEDELRYGRSS